MYRCPPPHSPTPLCVAPLWAAMHVRATGGSGRAGEVNSSRQFRYFYIPESFNQARHQVTHSLPCVGCHTHTHPHYNGPCNLALWSNHYQTDSTVAEMGGIKRKRNVGRESEEGSVMDTMASN